MSKQMASKEHQSLTRLNKMVLYLEAWEGKKKKNKKCHISHSHLLTTANTIHMYLLLSAMRIVGRGNLTPQLNHTASK